MSPRTTSTTRLTTSLALVATLTLGLSACGSSHPKATTSPSISSSTGSVTPSSSTSTSSSSATSPSSSGAPTNTSSSSATSAHSTGTSSSSKGSSSSAKPSSSTTSGVSVPAADPATATKPGAGSKSNTKTLTLGGKKISLPDGLSVISSDAASARVMRGDKEVIMLSSATGVEELGPLAQRCTEAGQNLSDATTEHAAPKVSMSTSGSAQVCSVTVTGTLQGQSTKGVITMYDVLDAAGTDYTINAQDFSKSPSSKDADAIKTSLLSSVSKEPKAVG